MAIKVSAIYWSSSLQKKLDRGGIFLVSRYIMKSVSTTDIREADICSC